MSFSIDEQIFGFEIAIDNIFLVHIANGEQYFADIEHSNIVAKSPILPEAIEELPSRAKLEDHIDEGIVLEGRLEGVDEGVV